MTDNQKKIEDNHKFWDIKKAGNRLLWRFSEDENGNMQTFSPNEDDVLALKSVLACLNREFSGVFDKHNLFAKLYLMQLVGEIRENSTTVFNELVFVELSNQLSKPLELFYKAFYQDLASNQLNKLLEKKAFTDKEGKQIVVDYQMFKKEFPYENVKAKLNEKMISTLHRRSR